MRRLLSTALALLLAAAFYLQLIDTTDHPELYVLCGVAGLAAAAYHVSRHEHLGEASIMSDWLSRAWRPVARVPAHVLIVSRELFAQLIRPRARRGEFRAVSFSPDDDGNRDAGRRMLAEAFGSLAPNTIVLGVDRERNLLLVHQLRRTGDREELDVLDLG